MKDQAIVLRCESDLAERLSQVAEAHHVSKSEVVRDAVRFWLDLLIARELERTAVTSSTGGARTFTHVA